MTISCRATAALVAAVLLATLPIARATAPASTAAVAVDQRPNVVLVLLDDMSMDLLPTMRSAHKMRGQGAWYPHAYVVDSLCCVSRASTFTGQYPHQTGVLLNVSVRDDSGDPRGGWPAFAQHGNQDRTVAVRLRQSGYTTGYVGKYLNEYDFRPGRKVPPPIPGWDFLKVVFFSAYDGWDFWSSELVDGQTEVRHHPAPPSSASRRDKDRAYAGHVIERAALDFIRDAESGTAPYFLQVAPYAPHGRVHPTGHYPNDPFFPPAFKDRPRPGHPDGNCGRVSCASLGLRNLRGYADQRRDNRPRRADGRPGAVWNRHPAVPRAKTSLKMLRNRAQMLQSADRMVSRILRQVGPDTYVILTSDNGFHLGQHGLLAGKGTPYTSDIRVPLLVVGPGVRPGKRRELVSNLDLAPTLERLAGLEPASYRSGRSLLPSLARPRLRERDYVFVEHTWGSKHPGDPDSGGGSALGLIPSYVAVRSRTQLLVRYDLDRSLAHRFVWEFYDLAQQGYEKRNDYGQRRHRRALRRLTRKIEQFDACSTVVRGDPVPDDCRTLTRHTRDPAPR